jgi:hypothetical protein
MQKKFDRYQKIFQPVPKILSQQIDKIDAESNGQPMMMPMSSGMIPSNAELDQRAELNSNYEEDGRSQKLLVDYQKMASVMQSKKLDTIPVGSENESERLDRSLSKGHI